jgi:hypothetical protein
MIFVAVGSTGLAAFFATQALAYYRAAVRLSRQNLALRRLLRNQSEELAGVERMLRSGLGG